MIDCIETKNCSPSIQVLPQLVKSETKIMTMWRRSYRLSYNFAPPTTQLLLQTPGSWTMSHQQWNNCTGSRSTSVLNSHSASWCTYSNTACTKCSCRIVRQPLLWTIFTLLWLLLLWNSMRYKSKILLPLSKRYSICIHQLGYCHFTRAYCLNWKYFHGICRTVASYFEDKTCDWLQKQEKPNGKHYIRVVGLVGYFLSDWVCFIQFCPPSAHFIVLQIRLLWLVYRSTGQHW